MIKSGVSSAGGIFGPVAVMIEAGWCSVFHQSTENLMMGMSSAPTSVTTATIRAARSWIGTPYVHQGALKGVGCDCLGLVVGVWDALIGPLPENVPSYSPDWAEASAGERLADAGARWLVPLPADRVRAGDVLLFRWRDHVAAKHLGIATAPEDGMRVSELMRRAQSAMYRGKLTGRSRVCLAREEKMVTKTSHYTAEQLQQLTKLSKREGIGEAVLLREALDALLQKYDI